MGSRCPIRRRCARGFPSAPSCRRRNLLIPGAATLALMLLFQDRMIENFWAETDAAILECLREQGAMSPTELAHRLGISPGESTTLICLLAAQGKIKIALVGLDEPDALRPRPEAAPGERSWPLVHDLVLS
jgi:hypothetical protein